MADFDKSRLGDYVDVAARIAEFRGKYPEGSLQPADLTQPFRIEAIGDRTFVVVVAAAYRTPDDQRPGIGMAYEPFPGRTPYTKDSELMNAETSAWGRAIVAVLAADTKRGIASADEVRNRQDSQWEPAEPTWDAETQTLVDGFLDEIRLAKTPEDIAKVGTSVLAKKQKGELGSAAYDRVARAAAVRLKEVESP